MKAVKIKMKPGYECAENIMQIDSICVEDDEGERHFYKRLEVYEMLKTNEIFVDIPPYSKLVQAISPRNEKYVKSGESSIQYDDLLKLPRA